MCRVKAVVMLIFWAQRKMRFERALGRVLRDIRLQAGLTRAECNEALSIAKLSQVENGQAVIKIETLVGLCGLLGSHQAMFSSCRSVLLRPEH
jgi:hypothetical protein